MRIDLGLAVVLLLGGVATISTKDRVAVTIGWFAILSAIAIGIYSVWTETDGYVKLAAVTLLSILFIAMAGLAIRVLTAGLDTEVGPFSMQLSVNVESMELVMDGGVPKENTGLYFLLPNVMIVNRGFEQVSLDTALHANWKSGIRSYHKPTMERVPIGFLIPGPTPFQVDKAFDFPLNLGPKESLHGSIAFLITPEEIEAFGGSGVPLSAGTVSVTFSDIIADDERIIWTN